MILFLSAISVIVTSVIFSLINLLSANALVGFFYRIFGFQSLPANWIQWIFTLVIHVLLFYFFQFILRRELFIIVNDTSHPLHQPLESLYSLLKNKGEGWPLYFLTPATIFHLLGLILVFLSRLNFTMWLLFGFLLIGFWALYIQGSPKRKEHLEQEIEEDNKVQKVPNIVDEGFSAIDFLEVLRNQDWFRDEVVFRIPWPGELPLDANPSWKASSIRFNEASDVYASDEEQKEFKESGAIQAIKKALLESATSTAQYYKHQAKVFSLLKSGLNEMDKPIHVLITTPVGSGRTTTNYIAAIYEALSRHRSVLIIFPDPQIGRVLYPQLESAIHRSEWHWHFSIATYWSDRVGPVVSDPNKSDLEFKLNPDILVLDIQTLHEKLLFDHKNWSGYLEQLGLIIVENMENYANIFGANASLVFTRLMRIANHYKSNPQILATAVQTASMESYFEQLFSLNPEEFSTRQIVDEDSRHKKKKQIIIWNRENFIVKRDQGNSGLYNFKDGVNRLMALLVKLGAKTVLLNKTTVICSPDVTATNQEVVKQLQFDLHQDIDFSVGNSMEAVYDHDAELSQAKPAQYDAAVVAGIPGSYLDIMHDLEHLGDDNQQEIIPIIIAIPDTPLQQYLSKKAPETISALVNPIESLLPKFNEIIQEKHLKAALGELSATRKEVGIWFGESGQKVLERMIEKKQLSVKQIPELIDNEVKYFEEYALEDQLLKRTTLLGIGSNEWELEVDGRLVTRYPGEQLGLTIFRNAVITFFDQRFQIMRVDPSTKKIFAERIEHALSTERAIRVNFHILDHHSEYDNDEIVPSGFPILYQTLALNSKEILVLDPKIVYIEELIFGYQSYDSYTYDEKGTKSKIEPPFQREGFDTRAFFLGIPGAEKIVLHTINHLIRAVLPMYLRGNPAYEIVELEKFSPLEDSPALMIYDAIPGGTGVADWFARGNNLKIVLASALDVLTTCPCTNGCRGCVEIHDCHLPGDDMKCQLDKIGATKLLGEILGIDTQQQIKHRVDKMEFAEEIFNIRKRIVEFIFPHKLDLMIEDVADLSVVDKLFGSAIGAYYPGTNEIRILPAKEQDVITVLAHEYAHNWQWKGSPGMSADLMDASKVPYYRGKLFIEGFAQFIEYKVADYYGFRNTMEEIHFRHYDEYAEGFQVLIWMQDNYGSMKVNEFIRTGKLIVNGTEISLEEMLERSKVKSRLKDWETRYKANPPDDDVVTEDHSDEDDDEDEKGGDHQEIGENSQDEVGQDDETGENGQSGEDKSSEAEESSGDK
jgi:DEAD/DEAH box helicase domain-containing protein